MKIAIVGTTCVGKTTYVNDFISNWSMYKTPTNSYRDKLKELNLPHSKNSTEETQTLILNSLIDQLTETSKQDSVIYDRSVLDVLAYSTWLNLYEKVSDKFLDQQRIIIRETLKLYDILFFIPLTKVSPVEIEDNGFREVDSIYRQEIDTIFKAFKDSYNRGDGRVFPVEDSPALIEIFGNQQERIKLTELYLTEEGKAFGEDQSLISDIIPATFK